MFDAQVKLVNIFSDPYNNAAATARSCYSSKIVSPSDASGEGLTGDKLEARQALRDRVSQSIFEAGHHTVLQHTHVQFALSNISRHVIHSFFHNHTYYNCVSGDTFITPFRRKQGSKHSKPAQTIAELYRDYQDDFQRPYLLRTAYRSVNSSGEIVKGYIKKVIFSGRKEVYEVKTRLGYSLKSTLKHRYMTSDGSYKLLSELKVGDFIKVNGIPAYKDKEWLKQKYIIDNLSQDEIGFLAGVSKHTIRTWVRKHKLQKELGSWSVGKDPHNKGKSMSDYEPLKVSSSRLKGKPSTQRRGELNSNWRGDKTKSPRDRAKLWYKAEECVVCGATKEDRRIERHHRDGDIYNNNPENILILCSYCHKQAHSPHGLMYRVVNDSIESITYVGEEDTYDLEMVNAEHNFVANGLVVHNSEQVSQRFVHIKPENIVYPEFLDDSYNNLYRDTVRSMMAAYEVLTKSLTPVVSEEYYRIFPARKKKSDQFGKEVQKKAQEIARYVLPLGTSAHMYHTISLLTLLRYHATADQYGVGSEARSIVNKMVDSVLQVEPLLDRFFKDPTLYLPEAVFEVGRAKGIESKFIASFDESLDGYTSKLIDFSPYAEKLLSDSVHEVLGLPYGTKSNLEAIDLVLNPANNPYLSTTLNTTSQSPLTRCLQNVKYVFRRKISHTADSQDQRHRMVPGSRPILLFQVPDKPDYITPDIIAKSAEAQEIYHKIMETVWGVYNTLKEHDSEKALYVLPNSVAVRYTETGDLLNLHHKWKARLCYNAQEEIWKASLEEVQQIAYVHPLIARYILPPCGLRKLAEVKPFCPEGNRYCGVPVWNKSKTEYSRLI